MSIEITVFEPQQIDIMRRTVAAGISNDEFALFLQVCQGRGLNPFNREIYALPGKGGKVTFQVSIDGLRLIAERSGKYRGQLGPFFCGKDGQWKEEWLESTPPVAAKVGILREGFEQPLWAVARYAAYAGTTPVWQKMPDLMIAKCCESLALRRAFPAEMGGLYTHEEMGQASDTGAPPSAIVEAAKPALPNAARLNELFDMGKAAGQWRNKREMLNRLSIILETEVTPASVSELTDDLLNLVEDALAEPIAF